MSHEDVSLGLCGTLIILLLWSPPLCLGGLGFSNVFFIKFSLGCNSSNRLFSVNSFPDSISIWKKSKYCSNKVKSSGAVGIGGKKYNCYDLVCFKKFYLFLCFYVKAFNRFNNSISAARIEHPFLDRAIVTRHREHKNWKRIQIIQLGASSYIISH